MAWIAAGATVASGLMGSSASKKAGKEQAKAIENATRQQAIQADQSRQDQMPFLESGRAANKKLSSLLGLDVPMSAEDLRGNADYQAIFDSLYKKMDAEHMARYGVPLASSQDPQLYGVISDLKNRAAKEYTEKFGDSMPRGEDFGRLTRNFSLADLNADPVYQSGLQFGLDEGTKGINSRAIAGGGYDSGATLKALTRFATDYGSTKANDSFNRFQTENTNIGNRLAGVSGAGQTATNQVNTVGQNSANNISGLITDGGNARAASVMGSANAWSDAIGTGVDIWNQNRKNKTMRDIWGQ